MCAQLESWTFALGSLMRRRRARLSEWCGSLTRTAHVHVPCKARGANGARSTHNFSGKPASSFLHKVSNQTMAPHSFAACASIVVVKAAWPSRRASAAEHCAALRSFVLCRCCLFIPCCILVDSVAIESCGCLQALRSQVCTCKVECLSRGSRTAWCWPVLLHMLLIGAQLKCFKLYSSIVMRCTTYPISSTASRARHGGMCRIWRPRFPSVPLPRPSTCPLAWPSNCNG